MAVLLTNLATVATKKLPRLGIVIPDSVVLAQANVVSSASQEPPDLLRVNPLLQLPHSPERRRREEALVGQPGTPAI